MNAQKQGLTILSDEKRLFDDAFDIFSLPPKEEDMISSKVIRIPSSIPITDSGKCQKSCTKFTTLPLIFFSSKTRSI